MPIYHMLLSSVKGTYPLGAHPMKGLLSELYPPRILARSLTVM